MGPLVLELDALPTELRGPAAWLKTLLFVSDRALFLAHCTLSDDCLYLYQVFEKTLNWFTPCGACCCFPPPGLNWSRKDLRQTDKRMDRRKIIAKINVTTPKGKRDAVIVSL